MVHKVFLVALLVSAFTLVVMIAGAASPWYHVDNTTVDIQVLEFLSGVKVTGDHAPSGLDCQFIDDKGLCVGDKRRTMYGLITADVVIVILFTAIQLAILGLFAFEKCSVRVSPPHRLASTLTSV